MSNMSLICFTAWKYVMEVSSKRCTTTVARRFRKLSCICWTSTPKTWRLFELLRRQCEEDVHVQSSMFSIDISSTKAQDVDAIHPQCTPRNTSTASPFSHSTWCVFPGYHVASFAHRVTGGTNMTVNMTVYRTDKRLRQRDISGLIDHSMINI